MKICFTGAQSTGKSYSLKAVTPFFSSHEIITEIVRKMVKDLGITVNEEGNELSQVLIFNKYLEFLLTKKNFISDRSILDSLSYSFWLNKKRKIGNEILKYQKILTIKYIKLYDYIFYFPAYPMPLVEDNFRSKSIIFRQEIDEIIQMLIKKLNIKTYQIEGNFKEKSNFIMDTIKKNYIN